MKEQANSILGRLIDLKIQLAKIKEEMNTAPQSPFRGPDLSEFQSRPFNGQPDFSKYQTRPK